MTTTHKTASGTVTLVGREWSDGQTPQASLGIARLIVHDDVTNSVWKYTGKTRDAAEALGRLYVGFRDKVAVLSGQHITIEQPPGDLYRGVGEPDEDGNFDEFEFDAENNLDIIAYQKDYR